MPLPLKLIDLTHPLSDQGPTWPGDPPTVVKPFGGGGSGSGGSGSVGSGSVGSGCGGGSCGNGGGGSSGANGGSGGSGEREDGRDSGSASDSSGAYQLNLISLGEHSATHLGAPSHYGYSISIDDFDKSLMVGKALFINCEQYAQRSIGASEIEKCLSNANPALGAAEKAGIQLVVIVTGWAVHWGSESYYWGENRASDNHLLPAGLDISAIRFIFDKFHAQIIGIDGPNIDYGGAALAGLQCGREIARRGAFHLENIAIVPTDLPSLVDYLLMPLRIAGGTGAPARLIVGESLFEHYA